MLRNSKEEQRSRNRRIEALQAGNARAAQEPQQNEGLDADREEMRAYIDFYSRQSKRAVERDTELAALIALKQKREDDLLQIVRIPRNTRQLEAALHSAQQAGEDIKNFVRPTVAAGRAVPPPAPPRIQEGIDAYMEMYAQLQSDRLSYIMNANPEQERRLFTAAKAINKCVHEILDELRAEVEAHDKSAGPTAPGHLMARARRDRGSYLNDAARGLALLEARDANIDVDVADLTLLIAQNRRVLEACDPKNEDKVAAMRRELLEMDIQIAQKTMEELKLARKLAAERKDPPARPWS
jgi:hypothetical protein